MYELVDYLVGTFVDKSQYELVLEEDDASVEIKVLVDKDAVNGVIGKGGKIAKAIRTIVKSAGQRLDKTYSVYIEEK